MTEKKFDLEKEYSSLKENYKLPSFKELSQDFNIEKHAEKESSFILREIRQAISEKLSAYHHLLEMLVNPTSPPIFIITALRNLDSSNRETIRELYKELSKIQVQAMKIDTIYKEESEAEFIKTTFAKWQNLKKDFMKILDKFEESFEFEAKTNERGYFG